MITNPNTLGLFDEHAREIVEIVHSVGGLVYNDGANFNAILGIVRPGDIGFDVMHYNLHKTFSSPHGGGGPGAGPVGVKNELIPFLPAPFVVKDGETYRLTTPERSIGKLHGFHGNWGVILRAYTYIRSNGGEGLRTISETAILNANYLLSQLRDAIDLAYDRSCMHEFVLTDQKQRPAVRTLDIAKRIIDYGFHPMTVYFPLIVEGAMLVEPTETETKQTLDAFAAAMHAIAREAAETPEIVTTAPHNAPITRLDEATAARKPNLRWLPAAPSRNGSTHRRTVSIIVSSRAPWPSPCSTLTWGLSTFIEPSGGATPPRFETRGPLAVANLRHQFLVPPGCIPAPPTGGKR